MAVPPHYGCGNITHLNFGSKWAGCNPASSLNFTFSHPHQQLPTRRDARQTTMASTPMDIDTPDGGSPANGAAPSLNISRTLNSLPSTSAITDVITNFRPTKVAARPSDTRGEGRLSRLSLRRSKSSSTKTFITAASVANDSAPLASSPLKKCSVPGGPDEPTEGDDKQVGLSSTPASAGAEHSVDATEKTERPCDATSDNEQQFKRDGKDGRAQSHILSLDFDDPGELLMTSESDETIQIYKVREGRHDKQLLSKKYGVKLAKFTHASSSIVYASTKVNGRWIASFCNSSSVGGKQWC